MYNCLLFLVRGPHGVPEGGPVDTLVDVGHALRHLGLRRLVVHVYTHIQVRMHFIVPITLKIIFE